MSSDLRIGCFFAVGHVADAVVHSQAPFFRPSSSPAPGRKRAVQKFEGLVRKVENMAHCAPRILGTATPSQPQLAVVASSRAQHDRTAASSPNWAEG